jgi:DivIVA domain-containing protein
MQHEGTEEKADDAGRWMSVAPEEVAGKTFPVVRRGYDQTEVDEFLREVAADYAATVDRLQRAIEGALDPERVGQEIKDILLAADNTAEKIKTKARAEAESLVHTAAANKRRTDEEIEKINRAADEKIAAAKIEAERIESEAKQKVVHETRKEIEQAKQYASELRKSAERRANDLIAETKRRNEEQQRLEQEMLTRLGKINGLVQKLKAHLETPDVIDFGDPAASDEQESARDLERA